MASPGISYWLEATIHSLFHSLCPLGLITINLTPCLSDAAARSAGLGEMFTKAMDHQHFDCGTPNCHFSFCPRWSHQPSVPMISVQWLVPVSVLAPGKPTWRPVTLCLSVVPLSPLWNKLGQPHFVCFILCFSGWDLLVDWLVGAYSSFCLFMHLWLTYLSLHGRPSRCTKLEFTPGLWSYWQFSAIVFKDWLKKRSEILPPWLPLNWIFSLRWWWTIVLWILVLCK